MSRFFVLKSAMIEKVISYYNNNKKIKEKLSVTLLIYVKYLIAVNSCLRPSSYNNVYIYFSNIYNRFIIDIYIYIILLIYYIGLEQKFVAFF